MTANHAVPSRTAWTFTLRSRDGAPFSVRPIRPDDLERERDFIRNLSVESRFNRLMHAMHEPSVDFLRRMVEVDYQRTMAFVAVIDTPQGEQFIGVARYAGTAGSQDAEFAFAVADAWQGRGVGVQLARILFRYAREHGMSTLYGDILATNHRMIDLARYLGLTTRRHSEDGALVRATLSLDKARSSA